ncbi:MAG: hypothetical protein WCJ19_02220 [bacterium]
MKKLTSLEKLNIYLEQGYLFHGSYIGDITILEPRQTNNKDEDDSFNIDNAIYATDNITTAIIFGVVDRSYLHEDIKKFTWSVNWSDENENFEVTAKVHESWREYIEKKGIGYVYVLPPDTFIEVQGCQRKSKVAVKPIDKIIVTLNDYYKSGGKLVFMTVDKW